MTASVGAAAPAFSLKDQDGNTVSSDALQGTKTLLVFIPFPFTGICKGELCTLQDDLNALGGLGAQVIAVTCDTRPANKRWADDEGYTFPILSDYWPHGAVSQAYGCFNEQLGCANRATYVIDASGVVRDIISSDQLGEARDHGAYATALGAI